MFQLLKKKGLKYHSLLLILICLKFIINLPHGTTIREYIGEHTKSLVGLDATRIALDLLVQGKKKLNLVSFFFTKSFNLNSLKKLFTYIDL